MKRNEISRVDLSSARISGSGGFRLGRRVEE